MGNLLKRILRRLHRREATLADKDGWIRQHVRGLTFADVGGLWGTVNEKVSVATAGGAAATTMIDVQPPDSKWWELFHQRSQSLGVAGYASVVGDICRPGAARQLGRFDLVHCSGIMYHVPDMFGFLRNLYRITDRYLILTSMVVPEVMANSHGTLRLPQGAMLSVPGMGADTRGILNRHFRELDVSIKDITDAAPQYLAEDLRFRTGPWWWLYSPETMKALVQVLPFTVVDEGWSSLHRTYSLLLQVNR